MQDKIDVEQLVALSYRIFLYREATASEIDFHVQYYFSGRTIGEVVSAIAYSTEAYNYKENYKRTLLNSLDTDAELDKAKRQTEQLSDIEKTELIRTMYMLAFGRQAAQNEVDEWKTYLSANLSTADFVNIIANSEERVLKNKSFQSIGGFSIGEIVQIAYTEILGTGANWADIEFYSEAIRLGVMTESMLVTQLFQQRLTQLASVLAPNIGLTSNYESIIYMLGTNKTIPLSSWQSPPQVVEPPRFARSAPRQLGNRSIQVSAIASMYKGEKYIASFLDNITSQTIFKDLCELVIVDACSPEREIDIIRPYMERFPNIRYHRTEERIGIYAAWNTGIKMAKGKYITNTNMDDLRRLDSFELQYNCFNDACIPDIVYQDFLYSFEEALSFDEIARHNIRSQLPVVTINNLIVFNSPHNAPMWRRSLHDDIGWFDDRYRSAGDCDFWLRCALGGRTFYKLNEPHVAYYWNPTGLSTGAETLGIVEHRNIMKELGPRLVPQDLLTPYEAFRDNLMLGDSVLQPDASRYSLIQSKLLTLNAAYSIKDEEGAK